MLRASNMSPLVSSPTFTSVSVLRDSLVPTLFSFPSSPSSSASSSSSLTTTFPFHKVSPFIHFIPKSFGPISPSPLFKPLPHLVALTPKASISSESGSGEAPSVSSESFSGGAATDSSENGSTGAGMERLVQHVLLKETDVHLVVEVLQRTAQGEDLSDLAEEYSICDTKEEGGMIGWIKRGRLIAEFEEAVFNAPLNKVVKCKTKLGWHLLQVLSEREAGLLKNIMPDKLHAKLQDPQFVEEAQLIDVREPNEVEQASLPGFESLPLSMFGNWGPGITSKLDPEKDVYVMCHHGVRSLYVAKWLHAQGFKSVFNVKGGIHAYAVEVDPSIPTY